MSAPFRHGPFAAAAVLAGIATGCAYRVPIERDQLPALAAYRATGSARVRSGDREVLVERRHAPRLAVRPNCTFREEMFHPRVCDGQELDAPLDDVEVERDRLRLRLAGGVGSVTGVTRTPEGHRLVELAHVRDGMLWLRGYRLEGWRPRWGFGASLLGPAQIVSFTGQYRPLTWLALDLGLLPQPTAWMGARGLFPALGPVRPFVGGFVFSHVRDVTSDPSWLGLGGARVGFDLELIGGQQAITFEFDIMRRLDGSGPRYFTCAASDAACAWGGIAYSILW